MRGADTDRIHKLLNSRWFDRAAEREKEATEGEQVVAAEAKVTATEGETKMTTTEVETKVTSTATE